jgi:hypothetical protein
MEHRVLTSPRSRPATSSTVATPNREEAQNPSPFPSSSPTGLPPLSNNNSPNQDNGSPIIHLNSTSRGREVMSTPDHGAEGRKDSVSSKRDSWIRRLSTIQVSSQGSPRSSVGPDSPSVTFSHGSEAPILQRTSSPVPLPPNKLVKRKTSIRLSIGDTPSRSSSRPHVPTLRRPATRLLLNMLASHGSHTSNPAKPKLAEIDYPPDPAIVSTPPIQSHDESYCQTVQHHLLC